MYKFPRKRQWLLAAITGVMAVFAIIFTLVAGFFVVHARATVKGYSMLPTLNSSLSETDKRDIVYINRFANAKVGDIVVLDLRNHPNFDDFTVKRLIATNGDIVNIVYDGTTRQFNLLVNDKIFYSKPYKDFGYNTYNSFSQYVESHQHDNTRISKDEYGNIKGIIIKSGEIFVLGDNWDVSKDSSLVGPFKKNTIIGRVDIVVKPHQNEFVQILKRIF